MVYRQAVSTMGWAAMLACTAAAAAAADRDPSAVVMRAAIKVRVRDASLPNYTCVETVNRDYYKPAASVGKRSCAAVLEERRHPTVESALRLILTDRLRLDVTMTERGEIYSWAGASRFEDSGIEQVVRRGPIGTGSFGAMLAIVFGQDIRTFHFEGNMDSLMEYSYRVPLEKSHYKVRAGDSWVYTAFSGRFLVNPDTAEVVRLKVETDELPPAAGSCQSTSDLEFGNVRIGDGEFLLPTQGRQRFVDVSAVEVENTTTFSSCREYKGESTVTFFAESPPSGAASPENAPSVAKLAAGLSFTFELTSTLTPATAAAGDLFEGRLVSALRDSKGKAVAAAHSPVEGRLLRVENHHTAPVGSTLVMKLLTVEIGGTKIPLAADRAFGRAEKGKKTTILLPFSWEQNAGVFQLAGNHAVLKAGFRSDWITR